MTAVDDLLTLQVPLPVPPPAGRVGLHAPPAPRGSRRHEIVYAPDQRATSS